MPVLTRPRDPHTYRRALAAEVLERSIHSSHAAPELVIDHVLSAGLVSPVNRWHVIAWKEWCQ